MKLLLNIPVFDWDGPTFLAFYAFGFGFALLWSLNIRSKKLKKFNLENGDAIPLEDPYDIAYLAGGLPRCLQLAIVRLLQHNSLASKTSGVRKNNLLVVTGPLFPDCNELDRSIYGLAVAKGSSGLPLSKIPHLTKNNFQSIQSRLAQKGLRPTDSELSKSNLATLSPLFALLFIGFLKLIIGLSRDKSVVFLALFLAITAITIVIFLSSARKLTPSGVKLLKKMRANDLHRRITGNDLNVSGSNGINPIYCSIALSGIGVASGFEPLQEIDPSFAKELGNMGNPSSSAIGGGSGGCSSGCSGGGGGGGGCGGGGCGGCGG